MPDGVREMTVAVSQGTPADVVLAARYRTAGIELRDPATTLTAAEIIKEAASAMVAQANHTRESVLSILKPASSDAPSKGEPATATT
jgi:hypothetical protein